MISNILYHPPLENNLAKFGYFEDIFINFTHIITIINIFPWPSYMLNSFAINIYQCIFIIRSTNNLLRSPELY